MLKPNPTRLRIVTGKGGVGKTTVACGLALAEARRGAKVLLCEANGRNALAKALEKEAVGYAHREVEPNLFVLDINPDDAVHEYVLLSLKFESLYKAAFENRVSKRILKMMPALSEMVTLGKIWFHTQGATAGAPAFDVIVFDAPATGHALSLFRTPQGVMDSVPAGPLRKSAQDSVEMLRAATTTLHIVLTPEEMPTNEAIHIWRVAQDMAMNCAPVVVNRSLGELPVKTLKIPIDLELEASWHQYFKAYALRRDAGESQLQNLPKRLLYHAERLADFPEAQGPRNLLEKLAADFDEMVAR